MRDENLHEAAAGWIGPLLVLEAVFEVYLAEQHTNFVAYLAI